MLSLHSGSCWQRALPGVPVRYVWLVLLCALFLIGLALTQLHLSIDSVTWRQGDQDPGRRIELPFSESFQGKAQIAVEFRIPTLAGGRMRIIPDERLQALTVNGRQVELSGINPQALSNWHSGFEIDLAAYLQPDANTMIIDIENHEGNGGVALEYLPLGWRGVLPCAVLALGFMLAFWLLASQFELQAGLVLMGAAAIVMICVYWVETAFSLRQFDIYEGGGHLDYLRYLLARHSLPPPNEGWEYHQPPLYYFSAAPCYWLGKTFPVLGWQGLLRSLSVGYFLIFLAAGLATLQLFLQRNPLRLYLAAFALCFWPAGFIHSVRVGNDVAFYACYALGLWAACTWWLQHQQKHFLWAVVWCVLAILSKSNGLALAATLIALLALKWLRCLQRRKRHDRVALWRSSWQLSVGVGLAVALSFGNRIYVYLQGRSADWLLSNVTTTINSGLAVTNSWSHFLILDLPVFVARPWLSAWDDDTGRQYFWNYLLRSAISSEFSFGPTLTVVATIAGLLLLLLSVSLLVGLVRQVINYAWLGDRSALRLLVRAAPLLISVISLLGLLMAYRYKVPYASNTDFRYIYPALISVLCLDAMLRPAKAWRWSLDELAAPLLGVVGILWVFLL